MTKHISFETVTYEVAKTFKFNEFNRLIDRKHVDEIKKAMLKDFDAFGPIEVNTITKNILDKQHTWTAYTELVEEGKLAKDRTITVHYIEVPVDEEVEAIVARNSNTKNWTLDDYFQVYYKKGYPSYVKLLDFCTKHVITIDKKGKPLVRYAATICKDSNVEGQIAAGKFTCTDEEFEEGHIKASEIEDILKIMGKTKSAHWIQPMASMWGKFRKLHSFSEWVKGFKYCSGLTGFNRLPFENKTDWTNIFGFVHAKIDTGIAA